MSPTLGFTLLAPWALVGAVVLPLLVWLYRRRPRFPRQDVPSLQFFTEQSGERVARHRRSLDRDLVFALAAAAALVLAAAGPALTAGAVGRQVRVVVSGGAPGGQRGYAARVEQALADLRRGLGAGDRLEVLRVPEGVEGARRPSAEALLAAARAGAPDLALIVSDVLVEDPDVLAIGCGDPQAGNVGIVAADLGAEGEAERLLVTLKNDSPRPARPVLAVVAREGVAERGLYREQVPLAPDEVKAVLVPVVGAPRELLVRLTPEPTDALAADDVVELSRRALSVAFAPDLPQAQREAVERALSASLTTAGFTVVEGEVDLRIERAGAAPSAVVGTPWRLRLTVLGPDESGVTLPSGGDLAREHPLTVDLSTKGLSLVAASATSSSRAALLLRLSAGGVRAWDLLVAHERDVELGFDVLRGRPAPAGEPFWPLFIDNLARTILGEPGTLSQGGAAVRRRGLLDLASTRLGRFVKPFDPASLAALPRPARPSSFAVAPWLAALGVVLLLLLWRREGIRARSSRYP